MASNDDKLLGLPDIYLTPSNSGEVHEKSYNEMWEDISPDTRIAVLPPNVSSEETFEGQSGEVSDEVGNYFESDYDNSNVILKSSVDDQLRGDLNEGNQVTKSGNTKSVIPKSDFKTHLNLLSNEFDDNELLHMIHSLALNRSERSNTSFSEDDSDENLNLEEKGKHSTIGEMCSDEILSGSTCSNATFKENIAKESFTPNMGTIKNPNLTKPNFVIGGVISPHVDPSKKESRSIIETPNDEPINMFDILDDAAPEHEDSLNSMISFSSTHAPESSECLTPPSLISLSSVPSSKKLEWDSGADLGYKRKMKDKKSPSLLSTLERMAIGNYTSVFSSVGEEGNINFSNLRRNRKQLNLIKGNKSQQLSSSKQESSGKRNHSNSTMCSETIQSEIVGRGKKNNVFSKRSVKYYSYDEDSSKVRIKTGMKNKTYRTKGRTNSLSDLRCSGKFDENSQLSPFKGTLGNIDQDWNNLPSDDLIVSCQSLPLCSPSRNADHSQLTKLRNSYSLEALGQKSDSNDEASFPHLMNENSLGNVFSKESVNSIVPKNTNAKAQSQKVKIQLLENYFPSLESANAHLYSLSQELKFLTNSLLSTDGSERLFSAYQCKILGEYIKYVGTPAKNEEDLRKKQNFARSVFTMISELKSSFATHFHAFGIDYGQPVESTTSSSHTLLPGTSESSQNKYMSRKVRESNLHSSYRQRPDASDSTYYMSSTDGENDNKTVNDNYGMRHGDYQPSRDSPNDKSLYQDWHGAYHVAHQPPGYSNHADSHHSGSTSENEGQLKQPSQLDSSDGSLEANGVVVNEALASLWTSTGSESAYETIRERHRNVQEALASSFEFYSTSPRDGRCHTVSGRERDLAGNLVNSNRKDKGKLAPPSSPNRVKVGQQGTSTSSSEIVIPLAARKTRRRIQKKSRVGRNVVDSHHTNTSGRCDESGNASSRASVVQIQRQKYIQRMRHYINVLEKLESALLPSASCEMLQDLNNRRINSIQPRARGDTHALHFPRDSMSNKSKSSRSSDSHSSPGHLPHYDYCFGMSNSESSDLQPRQTSTLRREKEENSLPFSDVRTDMNQAAYNRQEGISPNQFPDGKGDEFVAGKGLLKKCSNSSAPFTVEKKLGCVPASNLNLRQFNSTKVSQIGTLDSNIAQVSSPRSFDSDLIDIKFRSKRIQARSDVEFMGSRFATSFKEPAINTVNAPTNESFTIQDTLANHEKVFAESDHSNSLPLQNISNVDQPLLRNSNDNIGSLEKETEVVSPDDNFITFQPSRFKDIEERLKKNSQKINEALQIYNSKMKTPSRQNICKIIPSLDGEGNTKPKFLKSNTVTDSATEKFRPQKELSPKKSKQACDNTTQLRENILTTQNLGKTSLKVKNGVKFTVSLKPSHPGYCLNNRSLAEELVDINKENEIMTLQEALALARPTYVAEAEERRLKISRKKAVRRKLQARNEEIVADLPESARTPSVLRHFIHHSDESPLFSYRDIRALNEKIYRRLPEAQRHRLDKRKTATKKTNLTMAKFYSQKLKKEVLKGKTSRDHRQIISPSR